MAYDFSGSNINKFSQQLGASWLPLAVQLGIKEHERAGFNAGVAGIQIADWLKNRDRIDDLVSALKAIDRAELAEIFESGPANETNAKPATSSWSNEDTNLRDVLCGLYFTNPEIARVAEQAGINRNLLDFNGNLVTVWHGVVKQAKLQGKRDGLIQVALNEYPDHDAMQRAAKGVLTDVSGPNIEEAVQWQPTESTETLEKIIGKQSTLLPISFLELGLKRSQSVVRIERGDGGTGSGFLIAGNLVVTNHHVLEDANTAAAAEVQFNVQRSVEGYDLPLARFELDPDAAFKTSQKDDWTIVKIRGDANEQWGAIPVSKNQIAKNDRVNIIQHPGGGPKAVALYHNIVTFAGDKRVQYLTDTLPGSSGSPVFDGNWNLVAIHHSGGWLREPGSKQELFRNEGIAINTLIDGAGDLLS